MNEAEKDILIKLAYRLSQHKSESAETYLAWDVLSAMLRGDMALASRLVK